jgi:phenylalanyl-tRNA synthetase alpha subunit
MQSIDIHQFPIEIQKFLEVLYQQRYSDLNVELKEEKLYVEQNSYHTILNEINMFYKIWCRNINDYFEYKSMDYDKQKIKMLIKKYNFESFQTKLESVITNKKKDILDNPDDHENLSEFNYQFSELISSLFSIESKLEVPNILDDNSSNIIGLSKNISAVMDRDLSHYKNFALCHHCYSIPVNNNAIRLLTGKCYRNEKYYDRFRLPEFSMTELVFFGTNDDLLGYKEMLLMILKIIGDSIGEDYRIRIANDSFMSDDIELILYQVLSKSKIELQVYTRKEKKYVSIASINYHGNYFTKKFNINREDNSYLQSMCFGIGLDRFIEIVKDAGELL